MPITNTSPPPARKTPVSVPRTDKLQASREEALTGLGQLAYIPLLATKQYADAGALDMHGPGISREIAILAAREERVAKIVDPLLMVGPYAALVAAVLPLAMQLAVNHGRVDAGPMNTVPASALESRVKTQLAKMEAEQLRLQREAEAELKALTGKN